MKRSMKAQQSGFTLVEIAIVLVIIGLLLGGILKGQELINSAKVKSVASDFRTIPTYVYGYQDKFRALPGDDKTATTHLSGSTPAPTDGNGNGVILGKWDSCNSTDESMLFWQHVRLAGLAPGPTTLPTGAADCPDFLPKNSFNGKVGFSSLTGTEAQISGMNGTYQICSEGILGKFLLQLDLQMDDGKTNTGSLRAIKMNSSGGTTNQGAAFDASNPGAAGWESETFVVCYVF